MVVIKKRSELQSLKSNLSTQKNYTITVTWVNVMSYCLPLSEIHIGPGIASVLEYLSRSMSMFAPQTFSYRCLFHRRSTYSTLVPLPPFSPAFMCFHTTNSFFFFIQRMSFRPWGSGGWVFERREMRRETYVCTPQHAHSEHSHLHVNEH